MRIVNKRRIELQNPVPVYDLTVDDYHNFVLANGAVVHNSAKEARYQFQAVLPLKGKVANALKMEQSKTLESEEIINILAAIGYDIKAADPYARLSVGKIICLADPDPDGPFIGNTSILMRPPGAFEGIYNKTLTIEELANANTAFEVPVWSGGKQIWASASASFIKNVDQIVALEIGKTKFKVDLNHKWMCLNTNSLKGREVTPFNDNLVYVKAKDLRVGDRVFMPFNNNSKKPSEVDYNTRLGYAPVSKMRIQKLDEPVPVYCLNVPRYHHFILPSGVVSSNCHINSLLLALFYKYLPDLFTRGMIYVSAAPEFYAIHKGNLVTGDRLSVISDKLKKIGASENTPIVHIKGWGGINADLMRIFAMNPSSRRLIQIRAIEKEDRVEFVKLMNEDVEFRRELFNLPINAVKGSVSKAGIISAKNLSEKVK